MADDLLTIRPGGPVLPTCPRCGSTMIVIGRLADAQGSALRFTAAESHGTDAPYVRACYCNDCGEVTLTLE